MNMKVFLIHLAICCFSKVYGLSHHEKINSLDDFTKFSIENNLEKVQQDGLIFPALMMDLPNRLLPFIRSFFGYNRIKIRDQVKKTLADIEKLGDVKKLPKNKKHCIEDNKKLLLYTFAAAIEDWTCLKARLINLFDLMLATWDTIFQFTLVSDNDCLIPILCSGYSTAKQSTKMAVHTAKFLAFGTSFFTGMRFCQRDIGKFEKKAADIVDEMKFCISKAG